MWSPPTSAKASVVSIKPCPNFHLLSWEITFLIDITSIKFLKICTTLLDDDISKTRKGATITWEDRAQLN